jgi:predicted regulator of Ras-like GTPase activity (Roadblock/LC7/MglB family)
MVRYRSDQINRVLRAMHKSMDDIKASVVVNIDGLLVEAYPTSEEDASSDQVAALTATLIGLAEKTLSRLAQGDVQRLLLEGEDGVMVVYPSGKRAALAVLIKKEAKLGMAMYAVKRAAEEVAGVLGD